MNLEKVLKVAVRGGASDILLKPGTLPRFRYHGELIDLRDGDLVTQEMMGKWINDIVPMRLKEKVGEIADLDFGYESGQGHRFRVNLFRQRGSFGLVLRVINNHVKTIEELQLPMFCFFIFLAFIKLKISDIY